MRNISLMCAEIIEKLMAISMFLCVKKEKNLEGFIEEVGGGRI